jgi:hypothetical protein
MINFLKNFSLKKSAFSSFGIGTKRQLDRNVLLLHGAGFVAPFLIRKNEPRNERIKNIAVDQILNYLTIGYVTPAGAIAANVLFALSQASGGIGSALVMSVRDGLAQRTSMAVPFSHTSIPMQQANASLQYAVKSIGGAYSSLGNEASLFHAKYMSR